MIFLPGVACKSIAYTEQKRVNPKKKKFPRKFRNKVIHQKIIAHEVLFFSFPQKHCKNVSSIFKNYLKWSIHKNKLPQIIWLVKIHENQFLRNVLNFFPGKRVPPKIYYLIVIEKNDITALWFRNSIPENITKPKRMSISTVIILIFC